METLQLKAGGRARVRDGHPWVYVNELVSPPPPAWNGQAVRLRDHRGVILGYGLCASSSQIAWRRYSRSERPCDAAFLREALRTALARRGGERYARLVFADADDLPGLIVDRYGDTLVAQALSVGMDQRQNELTVLLVELTGATHLLWRNDAPVRALEGLPLFTRLVHGEKLGATWHTIDGVEYFLDFGEGQKTGFYLDQRPQHRRVATFTAGRRVLDCFCNQGGFALQAAKAGAAMVHALDVAGACIAAVRANAERNRLAVEAVEANVFDYFTAHRDESWDVIVLDPPSFARNRAAVEGALRGYKELNLRALRMLAPGGVLATYSCSQHVSRDEFETMLAEAAGDVRRPIRLLERVTQPLDHPIRLGFAESEYLKGALLQVDA